MRPALVVALLALLVAGCQPSPAANRDADPSRPPPAASTASLPAAVVPASFTTAPAEAPAAPHPAAPHPADDPTARALATGRLLSLRLPGGASTACTRSSDRASLAHLEARLDLGGGPPRTISLQLAHRGHSRAWRRPLAFARLATALGAHVVPSAALRRIPLGDIAALTEGQHGAPELLRELVILNDGTVEALAQAPAPGPPGPTWEPRLPSGACRTRLLAVEGAYDVDQWARWAAAPVTPLPLTGERAPLLRGYVESLVLDYLSGHILRRHLRLDDAAATLILDDNAEAFPARVTEHALDRLMHRLAAVMRFPPELRDALRKLGRAEAAALLAPGSTPSLAPAPLAQPPALPTGFEGWLLAPRTLVDLDERRLTLLSLIEARASAPAGATRLASSAPAP
ncbi:hypothetical protein [Chondromyces apiculatus]|uniref:Uncharacterized protein n=1 Tax=Chondromyces apiculatus DSM 436 TaxID=1192034 RepID=A0A017T604_9BACT|nr:hypothetical protein [Chondromyces apiculatus]EYF04011.1 Hypothetical protein CAP_4885 [Chondromyces apiculatus DSM 436]